LEKVEPNTYTFSTFKKGGAKYTFQKGVAKSLTFGKSTQEK
jgi:hypothetical protein